MPISGEDLSLINKDSSSSSRSKSSSEVVSVRVVVFYFMFHSFFIGIIRQIALKCSSLSFLGASSLSFCVLIRLNLLPWFDVSPGEYQRGVGAILATAVLKLLHYHEHGETGLSSLVVAVN
jgi:hypothetical protein